jgi:hypothetical protein
LANPGHPLDQIVAQTTILFDKLVMVIEAF